MFITYFLFYNPRFEGNIISSVLFHLNNDNKKKFKLVQADSFSKSNTLK